MRRTGPSPGHQTSRATLGPSPAGPSHAPPAPCAGAPRHGPCSCISGAPGVRAFLPPCRDDSARLGPPASWLAPGAVVSGSRFPPRTRRHAPLRRPASAPRAPAPREPRSPTTPTSAASPAWSTGCPGCLLNCRSPGPLGRPPSCPRWAEAAAPSELGVPSRAKAAGLPPRGLPGRTTSTSSGLRSPGSSRRQPARSVPQAT